MSGSFEDQGNMFGLSLGSDFNPGEMPLGDHHTSAPSQPTTFPHSLDYRSSYQPTEPTFSTAHHEVQLPRITSLPDKDSEGLGREESAAFEIDTVLGVERQIQSSVQRQTERLHDEEIALKAQRDALKKVMDEARDVTRQLEATLDQYLQRASQLAAEFRVSRQEQLAIEGEYADARRVLDHCDVEVEAHESDRKTNGRERRALHQAIQSLQDEVEEKEMRFAQLDVQHYLATHKGHAPEEHQVTEEEWNAYNIGANHECIDDPLVAMRAVREALRREIDFDLAANSAHLHRELTELNNMHAAIESRLQSATDRRNMQESVVREIEVRLNAQRRRTTALREALEDVLEESQSLPVPTDQIVAELVALKLYKEMSSAQRAQRREQGLPTEFESHIDKVTLIELAKRLGMAVHRGFRGIETSATPQPSVQSSPKKPERRSITVTPEKGRRLGRPAVEAEYIIKPADQ